MSKLTHVRQALEENPSIVIVGVQEKNYLPDRHFFWSHTVDFHVAPKAGGIYKAEELQALMLSLVLGLEPNCQDDFRESAHELTFGKLYFDENIGTETVHQEIVLTDEDMFSSSGFVDGKRAIEDTNDVQRRIWVSLFPNVQIAASALESNNKYSIYKSDLAECSTVDIPVHDHLSLKAVSRLIQFIVPILGTSAFGFLALVSCFMFQVRPEQVLQITVPDLSLALTITSGAMMVLVYIVYTVGAIASSVWFYQMIREAVNYFPCLFEKQRGG